MFSSVSLQELSLVVGYTHTQIMYYKKYEGNSEKDVDFFFKIYDITEGAEMMLTLKWDHRALHFTILTVCI